MANRTLGLFLATAFVSVSSLAIAADDNNDAPLMESMPVPAVEPDLERREFKESAIDSQDFEIGTFAGLLSIEDFGSSAIYGARVSYHVTEDWFVEASLAQSDAGETSFETLSGSAQLLTDDQRRFRTYSLSAGYAVLPGESFIGKHLAFNSALYLLGGVGNTEFAGSNNFTFSVGAGYRWLAFDWLSLHMEVRDHMFDLDVTGTDKTTHNLELSLGLSFFF